MHANANLEANLEANLHVQSIVFQWAQFRNVLSIFAMKNFDCFVLSVILLPVTCPLCAK